ncbi:MAG: CoA-binding protein [Thermoleophilia bacterium]|nr:CoA-binding protein [Thermoleophilia bacterium]
MDGIATLLAPRSLALVGASPRTEDPILTARASGVTVYAVNPSRDEVLGLTCHPSVAALPEVPDVAMLLLGHERVEAALAEALAAGVRAFVVPGVGAEAGPAGAAVRERIGALTREAGATMVGPNCMGLVVPGGVSCWIGRPPAATAAGRVTVLCQSGSVADAFISLGGRVGFRCIVSLGAEVATGVADWLVHVADDEATGAVGLFLETVREPAAFAEGLSRCAAAGKPVACLKVGRSEAGARAARSHTGALVGSGEALSATLRRYGVIETRNFNELTETLELLGRTRRPRGRRVAAVSESGGECALLADHAEEAGLPYPPLSDALVGRLRERFPNYIEPGNPVDAWAVAPAEEIYPGTLELLATSGEFDVLQAQVDLARHRDEGSDPWIEPILRALVEVADAHGLFPVVTSIHNGDPTERIEAVGRELDLPLLRGLRDGVAAIAHVTGWRQASAPVHAARSSERIAGEGALSEHDSCAVLERYGVPFAPRVRAVSPEEAARAAETLGFPVVVKIDGIAHKAREGGVVLGIVSPAEAAAAAARLGGHTLVARQLPAGVEAFVGMTRDPAFGPILAIGHGGVVIEALAGAISIAGPLDRSTALAAVHDAGFNEAAEVLADVLVAVSRLADEHPEIAEVDVNPLILDGPKAVAVDGLVVVGER